MYQFQAAIRALPKGLVPGSVLKLGEVEVCPLEVASTQLDNPLPVSFETLCEQFASWPRMFIEPDGAFVWTAGQRPQVQTATLHPREPGPASYWQVDGCLFDRRGSLLHVEVRGRCPPEACDQLLAALGWPSVPLLFEMSSLGLFVSEADFRKLAEAGIGCSPEIQ